MNLFCVNAHSKDPRALLFVLLMAIAAVGCAGITDPKPGVSFRATPEAIALGDSSVLSWSVSGAAEITVDNGIGPVAPVATQVVKPSSTTTYTLTARNSAGTTTATCTVTVKEGTLAPPSDLRYSLNPAVYVIGAAIAPNTPSSRGGPAASYSVASLPAGLTLNTGTGVISGTPTAATDRAVYAVTATNAAGSTTVDLTITVGTALEPPSNLTYSQNPAAYVSGTAIQPNTPTSSGGPVASYWAASLPAGLTLDGSTGVISGTPTGPTGTTVYVVTATNAAGSTTVDLTITVGTSLDPPSDLKYSENPVTYVVGTTVTPNTPSSGGGPVASYSVASLPAGLSLNGSTGAVSGTPTAATATRAYVVTATNAAGSTTASLIITVNPSPHALSGKIIAPSPGGITVSLSGTASRATSTDGSGAFRFEDLQPGAYTVTPSGANKKFMPASRSATLGSADVGGLDFTMAASDATATIDSVRFTSTTIAIGGSTSYVATVTNWTSSTLTGLALQGWVQQGTANRAAGGALLFDCGTAYGDLPPGTCLDQWSLNPSNSTAGTGTLVPGAATAVIELKTSSTVLSTFTAPITLQ